MSRLSRFPSEARAAFLAGIVVAAVVIPAVVVIIAGDRGPARGRMPIAVPAEPMPVVVPEPAPAVNYRGPITVAKNPAGDHPAPTVLPREPLNIVTDDCTDLEIPPNDDEAFDGGDRLLTVSWWDPGVNANRTLGILVDSETCRRHPGVRRALSAFEPYD